MLIDPAFFEFERKIIDKETPEVRVNLLAFIAKYETEFLEVTLGEQLAAAFRAGLEEETINPAWLALRDGATYLDEGGNSRRWKGLTRSITLIPAVMDGATVLTPAVLLKQSPIADYIYYRFVRNLNDQMTAISTVKNQGETSVSVPPNNKLAKAWNDMSEGVRELYEFVYANYSTYGWEIYGQFVWYADPLFPFFWLPYQTTFPHNKRRTFAEKMPLL